MEALQDLIAFNAFWVGVSVGWLCGVLFGLFCMLVNMRIKVKR